MCDEFITALWIKPKISHVYTTDEILLINICGFRVFCHVYVVDPPEGKDV